MEKTDKIKMLIFSLLKKVSTSIFSKLLPEYLTVKMSVIRTNDLNIDDFEISEIRINPKTKKSNAYVVNKTDKKTRLVETIEMVSPFGLSAFDPNKDSAASDPMKINYSIPVRFDFKPDEEPSEAESDEIKAQRKLWNFVKGLDEMAVNYIIEHSQEILKRKFASREAAYAVASTMYSPLVKNSPGKDGTIYPDRINIKLSGNDDNSGPNSSYLFFKDTATPLEITTWSELSELIPKGSRVKMILQPRVVLMPGKFFLKLHLMQMKVPNVKRAARITGYAFSDAPAEEDASEPVATPRDETHADDSDAEVVEEA